MKLNIPGIFLLVFIHLSGKSELACSFLSLHEDLTFTNSIVYYLFYREFPEE